MKIQQNSMYRKGYLAGYRDGVASAIRNQSATMVDSDFTSFPISTMALSTRACNCLTRAGCTHIADVVALSEDTISRMRNLGTKTAAEIALWMEANGICYSAWSKYL